jgi:antitoxin (DNA-binding transcriptional repressor) of toxin-antitoxin stability system
MPVVNMLEAKSSLSRLVDAVEIGAEREIIIARNGRPVARLVALREMPTHARIGVARGQFAAPADIDQANAEVAALFSVSGAAEAV